MRRAAQALRSLGAEMAAGDRARHDWARIEQGERVRRALRRGRPSR